MSREWYEREYISADRLWEWLDEFTNKINMLREEMRDEHGKQYSPALELLFLGRREFMSELGDLVHREQRTLGEVMRLNGVNVDKITYEDGEESHGN